MQTSYPVSWFSWFQFRVYSTFAEEASSAAAPGAEFCAQSQLKSFGQVADA